MLIIKIIGGLGNQMFQYAYAKSLKNNNYDIKLDITAFETYKLHGGYQLDKYNIIPEIATQSEIDKFYKQDLISKILNKINIKKSKRIKEKSLLFDEKLVYPKDDNYIDGYFQNEKYFLTIREEILKNFTIKGGLSNYSNSIKQKILSSKNTSSLHVRRGDYILNKNTQKIYGICDLNYYKKAMDKIDNKFEDVNYFIFSDDIEWVKENLKIENATYIDNDEKKTPHEDIYLMSLCHNNIIANSSFSWWGAWLNQKYDKVVIAPKRWFLDAKMYKESKDIVPKEWIKV